MQDKTKSMFSYTDVLPVTYAITSAVSPEGSVSLSIFPTQDVYDEGDDLLLNCSALGGPNNTFEWQQNGATLINETTSMLNISNLTANEGGTYVCVVGNAAGNDSSNITIYVRPVITTQPTDIFTNVSENREFVCSATGFPEPTYEWMMIGGNLTGNFSGESTSRLMFNPVQYGNEGDYFCQVTSGTVSIDSENVQLFSELLMFIINDF